MEEHLNWKLGLEFFSIIEREGEGIPRSTVAMNKERGKESEGRTRMVATTRSTVVWAKRGREERVARIREVPVRNPRNFKYPNWVDCVAFFIFYLIKNMCIFIITRKSFWNKKIQNRKPKIVVFLVKNFQTIIFIYNFYKINVNDFKNFISIN